MYMDIAVLIISYIFVKYYDDHQHNFKYHIYIIYCNSRQLLGTSTMYWLMWYSITVHLYLFVETFLCIGNIVSQWCLISAGKTSSFLRPTAILSKITIFLTQMIESGCEEIVTDSPMKTPFLHIDHCDMSSKIHNCQIVYT